MDITSYLLGKKTGGGGTHNLQNKDVTITENGTTNISADAGYDGLQNVELTTNVQPDLEIKNVSIISNGSTTVIPSQDKDGLSQVNIATNVMPNLENKSVTITENKTTTITPTQGKDGLSQVEVITNVSGGADLTEYMAENIDKGNSSACGFIKSLIQVIPPKTRSGSDLSYAYSKLPYLEKVDLSNLDFTNTTQTLILSNMFNGDSKLINVIFPNINPSGLNINMASMFSNCSSLETLNLSKINMGKCSRIDNCFYNCAKITNLTFGSELGKNYSPNATAHTSTYTLDLSFCTLLTHDSLMSVINNLYDISEGNTQDLVIGATNIAKLSQAEIDIATNKGWTVL